MKTNAFYLKIINAYVFRRGDNMETYFLTDRGQVRNHNEDSGGVYYNDSCQMLAVIADGMGGHQAGDIASQVAVKNIQESWKNSSKLKSPEEAEEWLKNILMKVNKEIYELSLQKKELMGMGTTIVVSIHSTDFITIGHIGDSRCYIQNEDGFKQVTEDHSLVNELIRSGQITEADAEHHPRKNIVLKAMGTGELSAPDIRSMGWEPNDKLLLCSDGLTDKMSNATLQDFFESDRKIEAIGKELVDLANERGGEDNISLIIIHNQSGMKESGNLC